MKIVIVNCFDTWENRVNLLCDFFIRNGNDVQVLTSDFRHIEKKTRTDEKAGFKFFAAKPYRKNLSIERLISHSKLSEEIFLHLENIVSEVDILWILIPPNSFVKRAAILKKTHGQIKIVFDLIDMWPESMPIPFGKKLWPFCVWKDLRDKHLSCADYIVTECKLYQNFLKDQIKNKKIETLYLARENKRIKSVPNLPKDKIALCYLGSINALIDISMIVDIVRILIQKTKVEIHIIGDGEKRENFISVLNNVGAQVLYHGKVYEQESKQKIFDKCHYGLNIMKDTVCVGLTMKSIDYFEAGLPIINNIKGDTWEFVSTEGIGINYCTDFEKEFKVSTDEDRRKTRMFFEDNFTIKSFNRKVDEIISTMEGIL